MDTFEEKIIGGSKWAETAAEMAGNQARAALKNSGKVLVGGVIFLVLVVSGVLRGFFRGVRGKKP